MLVQDINGTYYVLSHMYGLYTLRTLDNELLDYGLDPIHLVKSTLGHHARILEEDENV